MFRGIGYSSSMFPSPPRALVITFWHVPESRSPDSGSIDWLGASIATFGLAALVYGFLSSSTLGRIHFRVIASLIFGVAADKLACAPQPILLKAREWPTFDCERVHRRSRSHLVRAHGAQLAARQMQILRREPESARPRRRSRNARLCVHTCGCHKSTDQRGVWR